MHIELAPGLQALVFLLAQLPGELTRRGIYTADQVEVDAETHHPDHLQLRVRLRESSSQRYIRMVNLYLPTRWPLTTPERLTIWFYRTQPRTQRKLVTMETSTIVKAVQNLLEIVVEFIVNDAEVASVGEWSHLQPLSQL